MSRCRQHNLVANVLDRGIANAGERKLALLTDEERVTYGELNQRVRSIASALRCAGLDQPMRVILLMHDTGDLVACLLGVMAAGGIAVPVSTRMSRTDLRLVVDLADPFALLVDAEFEAVVRAVVAELGSRPIIHIRNRPGWLAGLGLEREGDGGGQGFEPVAVAATDPAFWLLTSGTTGRPKAVEHMHGNIACCDHFPRLIGLRADDLVLPTSRLSFAYTLGLALFGTLRLGATLALIERWPTAEHVAEAVGRFAPSVFVSVPVMYRKLMDTGVARAAAFRRLRLCISAGERLAPALWQSWRDETGTEILDGMGCSESIYMIFGNRPGEIALGSSGRPVPGVEVRLVDEAGAPIAEPDVPGALELRMRSLCAGYRIRLQSRAAELTRPAERFCGSWFATGDRYQRDAGDHYTHVGRVDDMMRIAAMWVAPCEIEDPISELEQIQDAAAVQVTSVEGLNEIHLFVVPAPGVAPDEVTRSIDARLSALDSRKKPRRIRILDRLPRTPTGKVQRHLLRMYDEHCDAPVTVLADAL